MKMTRSAKLFTGLGLMASLFWGCQDLLSQKDGSAKEPDAVSSDESALRLSIKDDSACRERWNMILDARSAGLADTAAEKSFLAHCVTEIKPGKDKLPPLIPPHLQPDSISRCHWIVAQIEGGRDEMTVSYKRYCPEDCRKLGKSDSTRHDHLCREPHGPGADTTKPPKPPIDTLKPNPPEDSCKLFRVRLATLDSTSVEAANLRQYLLIRCGKPPVDTTKPPRNPLEDSCKAARDSIAGLDTGSVKYKMLREFLLRRCGKPTIPPVDTLKPKPPENPLEDSCKLFRARLAVLDSASSEAEGLRRFLTARCGKPPAPNDSIVKPPVPPKDTLITPGKFEVNCDQLRATLLKVAPGSNDAKILVEAILQHCTEAKP